MSEESKPTIELSKRGKKQLKDVLYTEIRQYVDALIEPLIKSTIERRIKLKLERMGSYTLERLFKEEINKMYWYKVKEMLESVEFHELFKKEIINYLHKKWANDQTPFDSEFNKAMIRALKAIIRRSH